MNGAINVKTKDCCAYTNSASVLPVELQSLELSLQYDKEESLRKKIV